MKHILAQAAKELTQLRRDRLTLALAFLFPLGLMALFGKSITISVKNIPLALQDLDNTPLSRAYIESLAATQRFRIAASAEDARHPESVLQRGEARAVVVIPPGFERDMRRGAEAAIQVLVDGSDANTATIIRYSMQAVTQAFRQRLAGGAARPPIAVSVRFWYNPGLEDEANFAPGALALVLIMAPALLTALAMAREPEQGTVIQVYASSLTAAQWLLGKGLAYYAVAWAQFVSCFTLGKLLFGFAFAGNPWPLLLGTGIYLAGGVFFGLLAGALMESQSTAIQLVQFLGFLFSLLLSGFIFPVSNIPRAIRWISVLVPARHYIELVRDALLRGSRWDLAARSLVALSLLTLFFFAAGWLRLRRMQFHD